MVLLAALVAMVATTALFLLLLTIALLTAERGRRNEIAALERQVADLTERSMTPAERVARDRRHQRAIVRHRRANDVFAD